MPHNLALGGAPIIIFGDQREKKSFGVPGVIATRGISLYMSIFTATLKTSF